MAPRARPSVISLGSGVKHKTLFGLLPSMIICASRRTDIPAFHSEWMMNRLRAGYTLVRNPVHRTLVYRVDLAQRNVDAIVFVTKNPAPMVPRLKEIGAMGHTSIFMVTVTPYGRDLEPGVPFKADVVDAFKDVSDTIGRDRILWRYDPVIVDSRHSVEWHRRRFGLLCRELEGYTDRCIFSFLEMYGRFSPRNDVLRAASPAEMDAVAAMMAPIAVEHGIRLSYCCPRRDLSRFGIDGIGCIDRTLMRRLGIPFEEPSAPLREGCSCVRNIDIGEYDTCGHNCAYCYANATDSAAREARKYDPESELLCGALRPGDEIVTLAGRRGPRLSDYTDRAP